MSWSEAVTFIGSTIVFVAFVWTMGKVFLR